MNPQRNPRRNCRGRGTWLFFPLDGGSSYPDLDRARRICAACPIAEGCLEWALVHREEYGIWGGTTERERRRIRSERGELAGRKL